jgi:hypothetical protein
MNGRDAGEEPQRVHADGSADGEGPAAERPRDSIDRRTATLTAAGMLVVGLLGGWMIGAAGDNTTISDEFESTVPSPVATSTVAPTTTSTSSPSVSTRFPLTSLEVSSGASELAGVVVVAPHPGATGGSPLWILSGEGLVRRYEVPLWPGDYPNPLILSGNQVAFADLETAYLADIGLDGDTRAVSDGSFLLPSGTTDLIWIVGDGAEWVAQLDPSTGAVGERFDVSAVIGWPEGGLESGLLVRPVDEATFGQVAHWTPDAGLQSVEVDDPHSRLLTASGTLAVFLSPGNTFQVLDVVRSTSVGRFSMERGEFVNVEGCLSPNGSLIALFGREILDVVVSLTSGDVIHELESDVGVDAIGWVSSDQLVIQTTVEEGRMLQVIDLPGGTATDIASLSGLGSWWMTASGSNC